MEKQGHPHGYLGVMIERIRGGIRVMVSKRKVERCASRVANNDLRLFAPVADGGKERYFAEEEETELCGCDQASIQASGGCCEAAASGGGA